MDLATHTRSASRRERILVESIGVRGVIMVGIYMREVVVLRVAMGGITVGDVHVDAVRVV